MAGRGMLFAEGPTACPFVALETDRDRRSAEPDPRHRCYAEPTPAPRALAHQREFCLSPGFGGCPIFQDWALRAAARPVPLRPMETRPEEAAEQPIERLPSLPPDRPAGYDEPAAADAAPPPATAPADEPPTTPPAAEAPATTERPRRRWTEEWPPAAASGAAADASEPSTAEPPAFLTGRADQRSTAAGGGAPDRPPRSSRRVDYAQVPESAGPRQQGRPSRRDEWAAQRADLIPAWERERYAAYPSLATRMGLGDAGELLGRLTRIFAIMALIALVIALLIVAPRFFPAGIGGPTPSPTPGTPGPTLPPTPTPPPTPAPSPSPQLYTIQPGDTLFGIAGRHAITVDQLLAANPQITDPNLIQAGQVIVIPPPDFGLPTLPPASTGDPSPAAE